MLILTRKQGETIIINGDIKNHRPKCSWSTGSSWSRCTAKNFC